MASYGLAPELLLNTKSLTVPTATLNAMGLGGAGTAAAASAASSTAAATGSGMLGAMSGLATAAPWLLGAIGLAGLFGLGRRKPVVRTDPSNFDQNADLRSQADKMYSPMFMSGMGSTYEDPTKAYSTPFTPMTGYSKYSQQPMLGLSGFNTIRGFGGMGGAVQGGPQPKPLNNNLNWSGFATPLTNFGSGPRGGIKGVTSVDGKSKVNAAQLDASRAGYQLRF